MFGIFKDIKVPETDMRENSFRAVTQADIVRSVGEGKVVFQTDHKGLCTIWLESLDAQKDLYALCLTIAEETAERSGILIKDWDFIELAPIPSS